MPKAWEGNRRFLASYWRGPPFRWSTAVVRADGESIETHPTFQLPATASRNPPRFHFHPSVVTAHDKLKHPDAEPRVASFLPSSLAPARHRLRAIRSTLLWPIEERNSTFGLGLVLPSCAEFDDNRHDDRGNPLTRSLVLEGNNRQRPTIHSHRTIGQARTELPDANAVPYKREL